MQYHKDAHFHNVKKGEARQENIGGLSLAAVRLTTVQVTRQPL
jgi:hypothetical protein